MYKTLGTHNYYIYILTNKIKTVLYIGITNNIPERLYAHQNPEPNSKAFTTKYKCHYLVYWERYDTVDDAIERETQFKKWNRNKKDSLIVSLNPEWKLLNNEISDF
jgi:putative endonuclease